MSTKEDRALEVAENVREGATKIHKHPRSAEIIGVLSLYGLEPRNRRIPFPQMEKQLVEEFGLDLKGDGAYLQDFMERYIGPSIVATDEFVARSIYRSGEDLNTTLSKLQIANRLKARFEQAARDPTSSAGDVSALGKAALDAYTRAEDSMERFSIIPGKKGPAAGKGGEGKVVAEFDFTGVLKQMEGREVPGRADVIDVESEDEE